MSHSDRDETTTGHFVDASHKGYFKNCKFSNRMLLNIKFKNGLQRSSQGLEVYLGLTREVT